MRARFFITGTDTGVGKTQIAAGLLALARRQGLSTAAVKPVAAGCEPGADGLQNEDALLLQAQVSLPLSYAEINPVALAPAIAPHIAAAQAGRRLTVSQLAGYCRGVFSQSADFSLVEGAGGWRVPLNNRETLADLCRELNLPVIMVVAVKLGCLNHSLLTAEAIRRDGLSLVGWVANLVDPAMPVLAENLQTLADWLPAPCLGQVPVMAEPRAERVADFLTLPPL